MTALATIRAVARYGRYCTRALFSGSVALAIAPRSKAVTRDPEVKGHDRPAYEYLDS